MIQSEILTGQERVFSTVTRNLDLTNYQTLMRKTLRLLDWIVNDIDEAKKKLEAVIDDDLSNNDELQKEAEEAEQEIVEARRKILHASDTLRQIYNECYED